MRPGTNKLLAAALIVMGSTVSFACFAHWEGVEAADPSTPAALLSYSSATARYIASDSNLLPWRERLADFATEDDVHVGYAGADSQTPTLSQQ